ncbi:putative U3 small nucleolar RNA-associated protein 11 [Drosera capensis]
MSSFKNAIPRRAHKERPQPESRKKFGLLEKHKDYVVRARAFHRKEEILRKLKVRAANRNPDEFYFKMINTRTVDGVHKPGIEANKYSPEELMLMKTQDKGYLMQKIQSEKKASLGKIEKLEASLHFLDGRPPRGHVYYAEDSEEAKEIRLRPLTYGKFVPEGIPSRIMKKVAASYRELEARKKRVNDMERIHNDMALKMELQKKGRKRKLREDEIVCPTMTPVYKWRPERKR